MLLADTLSGAYLPSINASEYVNSFGNAQHISMLAVSLEHLAKIKGATADYHVLQYLRKTICTK